jgi:hypothetical protein
VSSWLIPSLGLPVVMTTGRLVVLTVTGVSSRHVGAVTAATGSAVMLLLATVCGVALVGLRRRRASRRGSIS